jgi:hypothetical protein
MGSFSSPVQVAENDLRLLGHGRRMTAAVEASDNQRAHNEILFREVNERVEEITEETHDQSNRAMIFFVCECGNTDCLEKIELTRSEYERIRANPKHFAVLPGHEDPRIARVVENNDRFAVAEKFGEAAEMAIEQDPRDE